MECSSCGETFRVKRLKVGLVTQCDQCGAREERERGVNRSIGLIGGAGINKSNAISIWRDPTPTQRRQVKQLNGGRYNAGIGLPLGNVNEQEKE